LRGWGFGRTSRQQRPSNDDDATRRHGRTNERPTVELGSH
jgi:hypothetical protein